MLSSISLQVLNGLLQKKPLSAENGEGCGDLMIKCLSLSIRVSFCWAKAPRKMKTRPVFWSESFFITSSVKWCRPMFLCELGASLRTVSPAFRRRTPCFARCSRLPLAGGSIFKSDFNSLKIFLKEGGILTP